MYKRTLSTEYMRINTGVPLLSYHPYIDTEKNLRARTRILGPLLQNLPFCFSQKLSVMPHELNGPFIYKKVITRFWCQFSTHGKRFLACCPFFRIMLPKFPLVCTVGRLYKCWPGINRISITMNQKFNPRHFRGFHHYKQWGGRRRPFCPRGLWELETQCWNFETIYGARNQVG